MTVDLSKLKAGDTVHFRCGGSAEIEQIELTEYTPYVHISLKGSTHGGLMWFRNGRFDEEDSSTDPFDIIRMEPKPFNWKDAKPGMAFKYGTVTFWCLCPDYSDDECAVMTSNFDFIDDDNIRLIAKEELTRAPEDDITVEAE